MPKYDLPRAEKTFPPGYFYYHQQFPVRTTKNRFRIKSTSLIKFLHVFRFNLIFEHILYFCLHIIIFLNKRQLSATLSAMFHLSLLPGVEVQHRAVKLRDQVFLDHINGRVTWPHHLRDNGRLHLCVEVADVGHFLQEDKPNSFKTQTLKSHSPAVRRCSPPAARRGSVPADETFAPQRTHTTPTCSQSASCCRKAAWRRGEKTKCRF